MSLISGHDKVFSPSSLPYSLRPAYGSDAALLEQFLNGASYVHRHLDWRQPGEWLGSMPFWVMASRRKIQAALAVPEDPAGVAWIQLFGQWGIQPLKTSWGPLFDRCLAYYRHHPVMMAAVCTQAWFAEFLSTQGFTHFQDIVVLAHRHEMVGGDVPEGVQIRPAEMDDLDHIFAIDQAVFEFIWRLSRLDLEMAYRQATHTTVAVKENEIVGYQLSTGHPLGAHLARLAVKQEEQGCGTGALLVKEMLQHYQSAGISEITVNTQSNNVRSLSVYQRLGFYRTGERFPIYTCQV